MLRLINKDSLVNTLLRLTAVGVLFFLGSTNALSQEIPGAATGVWNGYYNHYNVVECLNPTSETISARLTVRNDASISIGTSDFQISPHASVHTILNQFSIRDSFGTYTLTDPLTGEAVPLTCLTSVYRLAPAGAPTPVEYAFVHPMLAPFQGSRSGVFNSMNPNGDAQPVYNWLSIYNPGLSAFSAIVEIYAQDGSRDSTKTITITDLLPGQRRDFAVGHEWGQVVGLYRIIPNDDTQHYGAFLTRYSQHLDGSFNFAFPLLPLTPSCDSGAVPASTMDPATNWAELANPTDNAVAVDFTVRNTSGLAVHGETITLTPHSQQHIYLNQHIGERNIGSFSVRCVDNSSGAGVLTQSLFYGHLTSLSQPVEWAYATQARGIQGNSDSILVTPYNTNLGGANWNKLLNVATNSANISLDIYNMAGTAIYQTSPILPASGNTDIDIHSVVGSNVYGAIETLSAETDDIYSAELLRVFPHATGGIGYIMNVAPFMLDRSGLDDATDDSSASSNSSASSGSTSSAPSSPTSNSSSSSSSSSNGSQDYAPLVPPGTNVALGRSTTFNIAPNYVLTTNANDGVDLTDGKYSSAGAKLYTSLDSVGWSYINSPIIIYIDLGETYPISSLSIDTSAYSTAGVFMPAAVQVYVTDSADTNSAQWHHVENLMTEAVSQVNYVQHKFSKSVYASARQVAFVLHATHTITAVDEIEVITGDFDPASVTYNYAAIASADLATDADERLPLAVESTASLYLVAAAEDAITDVSGGDAAATLATLAGIREDILATTTPYGVPRANGLPYTPLDALVGQAVGGYMATAGLPAVSTCVHSDSLPPMLPFDRPAKPSPFALSTVMMMNERQHVSFCVTNNTATDTTVTLSATTSAGAPTVKFREEFFVLAPGYQFIGDALPEIPGGALTIPAGMTKGVWVELNSKLALPGSYNLNVIVTPTLNLPAETIPLAATVDATTMPNAAGLEFLSTTFDYPSTTYNSEHEVAVVADLEAHYSNVQFLNSGTIPIVSLDGDGNPIFPVVLNYSALDEAIALRPNVKLWILGGIEGTNIGQLVNRGTATDEAAFKSWITQLSGHLAAKGITGSEFALFPNDEPVTADWNAITTVSTWAKEAVPGILIFQNWNNSAIEALIVASNGVIDISCPTSSRFNDLNTVDALFDYIATQPLPACKYDSNSSLAKKPYSDYRIAHWASWNGGPSNSAVSGVPLGMGGKWVYLTTDPDPMEDYGLANYSMAYTGPNGPITSKRWEAWADGIEDFELLRQLKAKADLTGDATLYALLQSAVSTVLTNSAIPSYADLYHTTLLTLLP